MPNPNQPNVVEFRVDLALEWSLFRPPPALGTPFNIGDSLAQLPIVLTPTFINTATDSLIGTAVISYAFPTTPPQTTYRASYSGCCWLSTLRDGNNDASYNVWTTIPIDMSATQVNHAPAISSVPMVGLFLNTPWSFRFPAVDADGDLVSYRLTCANAVPIGSKNMA